MSTNGASKSNPLQELAGHGQAFWYDNIRRQLLRDGSLKKLVDQDGLRGVTANPTIFEQAISAGDDYDEDMRLLTGQGADANAVYERLASDDVRTACDIMRGVYDSTNGLDGYVSLEVSPLLARDTQGTIDEVKRFWALVDRPNVMIKIPATQEGLEAIEQSLAAGINVNVTLIFAVERYIEVANAFTRALQSRAARGEAVDRIASVASFFVSRVDSKIDGMLDKKIAAAGSAAEKQKLEALKGKAGIANAKVAYEQFKRLFYGDAFAPLKAKGARVQRPLWASTSTKNPAYRDVMYVEELIGRDTVDTMPPKTIDSFRDHGTVADTLDAGIAEAHAAMKQLAEAGIDIKQVTRELEEEGVASFAKSFETLAEQIGEKQKKFGSATGKEAAPLGGSFQGRIDPSLDAAAKNDVAARIWSKDATTWKPGTSKNDPELSGWLGWLDAPKVGIEAADDLLQFVEGVRKDGFTYAVVLGMGGSSLAPEVFAQTFGRREGYPELLVLDSTDPANVLAIEKAVDLKHTLFMVSSKSGSTTEPNTFHAYFWEAVKRAGVQDPAPQFVAITDAGSSLDRLGREQKFRRVFTNDPEIGGRYSALSFFGLVPAALAGVDIKQVLQRAQAMAERCRGADPRTNPGVMLGTILGELAKDGRDKVTFLPTESLASFGLWGEQLIAESTGKEGRGLIPVAGEAVGLPAAYGDDRVFVLISVASDRGEALPAALQALEKAGQPVVRLQIDSALDLGAEFFRWEFATAVAGAVLGINPFDQPNVQESKDNTKRLLGEFEKLGKLPESAPSATSGGISLTLSPGAGAAASLGDALRAFVTGVKPGDYLAIMAYLPYTDVIEQALQDARLQLRNNLRVATTLGYGPRFLHSTGQLHKGGPNTGVFVQITAGNDVDAAVPGEKYSFSVLEAAQALGDLQSLQQHGRRVVRLHIDGDVAAAIGSLAAGQVPAAAH